MTQDELNAEQDRCSDNLDGADVIGVILIICTALDMDPVRVLAKIRMEHRLDEHESIIDDILQSSQSNLKRSLHQLHRWFAADEMLSNF